MIQNLDVEMSLDFEGLDNNFLGITLMDVMPTWFEAKYGYDGTGTDGKKYEMFWFPDDMETGVELIKKMYEACDDPKFANCRFELSCYYI